MCIRDRRWRPPADHEYLSSEATKHRRSTFLGEATGSAGCSANVGGITCSRAAARVYRSAWARQVDALVFALLVVGPHPQHLDNALIGEDLVDQAMLDVDPPREGTAQVADELLERRRGLELVLLQDVEERLGLRLQTGGGELPCVFARLLRVEQPPAHQSSSPSSSSAGAAMPSRMDSRMPGIETR